MLDTRDRVDELRELEELWAAPAAPERPLVRRQRAPVLPRVGAGCVAGGWVAFIFLALTLAPSPEAHATTPLWVDAASGGLFLLLAGAALVGGIFPRVGFAAATLAGGLGIATSVACRATEHHLGNWWLVELGATAALTGAAAVGLAQRLHRK